MSWTLYCHTHIASGRRYVGITERTLKDRWRDHLRNARYCRGYHFASAIRTYGENAFSHDVLQENLATRERANIAEAFATDLLCTTDPNFGFNIVRGGGAKGSSFLHKNPWQRSEYRVRGLVLAKERWLDPEMRARHRRALKETLAKKPRKTHCPKGHPYDEVNTYRYKDGRRGCIICGNDRQRIAARIRNAKIRATRPPMIPCYLRPEWIEKQSADKKSRPLHAGLVAQAAAMRAKTHCPRGHAYSPENTRLNSRGGRLCKTCIRERRRKPSSESS